MWFSWQNKINAVAAQNSCQQQANHGSCIRALYSTMNVITKELGFCFIFGCRRADAREVLLFLPALFPFVGHTKKNLQVAIHEIQNL